MPHEGTVTDRSKPSVVTRLRDNGDTVLGDLDCQFGVQILTGLLVSTLGAHLSHLSVRVILQKRRYAQILLHHITLQYSHATTLKKPLTTYQSQSSLSSSFIIILCHLRVKGW